MAIQRVISFRVDEDLKRRVDEVAHRIGRSRAWVIRRAIEFSLEDVEDIEMSKQRLADPNNNTIFSDKLMSRL
jgi:predicted DNA-binding protein